MYATVSTWRLHESIRSTESLDQFVREFLTSGINLARRAGALDVLMIELEPDRLMAVTLFETLGEATEANGTLQHFVAECYSDRLTTLSRVTGRAYDPCQLHGAGDGGSKQAAAASGGVMHASLVTWRLDPSIRTDEGVEQFLNGIWERYAQPLQRLGLLDVVVIRTAEDSLLAVRLYTGPIEHEAAFRKAVEHVNELIESRVTFVSKHEGRAFDVPQLLGQFD